MPASNAIESQGFQLQIASSPGASPNGYTNCGEVTGFSGLDGQASEIDVTHMQSTAKEFLMGLQDWGGFNVDTNYLSGDTGQDLMRAAKASRDIQDFKAILSDATYFTFRGYVLSAPISGGVDAKVGGSFNVRISGDVTFSA